MKTSARILVTGGFDDLNPNEMTSKILDVISCLEKSKENNILLLDLMEEIIIKNRSTDAVLFGISAFTSSDIHFGFNRKYVVIKNFKFWNYCTEKIYEFVESNPHVSFIFVTDLNETFDSKLYDLFVHIMDSKTFKEELSQYLKIIKDE